MPVSAAVRGTGVGTVSYTGEGMLRAWELRRREAQGVRRVSEEMADTGRRIRAKSTP